MSDVQLFEIDVTPLGMVDRDEKPSADRRRTEKARLALASGEHPTGFGPIDRSRTCAECVHSIRRGWGKKHYWKCDLRPITNGAGTDIRISWPACPRFEVEA